MRKDVSGWGFMVAVACSICCSNLAYGQGFPGQNLRGQSLRSQSFRGPSGFSTINAFGFGTIRTSVGPKEDGSSPTSGTQFGQRSITSVTGSRSTSFMKDGKRVSVAENGEGITVTVDGKRVRAKDAAELKSRYPDVYRFYDEGLRNTTVSARAFAGGSVSAGGNPFGPPAQFNVNGSRNRSLSVLENGKRISITENNTGITVSINGRRVRAKDIEKLKTRFPEAFRAYEEQMGQANPPFGQPDASALLREELRTLRNQNADHPQLRNVLERMMGIIP